MKIKVTQYGYPSDPDGDTLTEEGWGAWDNKLTEDGCALTNQALIELSEDMLMLPFYWIKIDFKNGTAPLVRQYQDKAPESDARVDLYMPSGFDKFLPDAAEVTNLGKN